MTYVPNVKKRQSVLHAMDECDALGEKEFLRRYGFKPSEEYFAVRPGTGALYPSKAVLGVAYYFENKDTMTIDDINKFSGGKNYTQRWLERPPLGIEVRYIPKNERTVSPALAEEIVEPGRFFEGATTGIFVNAYERNAAARAACIGHYGCSCTVCGFNFKSHYGELGEGFIHVHHLRELASIGQEYEVDAVNDLRPVCPNCHAMLHRRRPALSIAELKSTMRIV